MEELIQSTQHWSSTMRSPTTVRLLQKAIYWGRPEFVTALLDHGVDVHQRINEVSSIEYAFDTMRAVELCSTNNRRAVVTSLLNHMRKRELNEFALAGPRKGLGLLHFLAVPPQSDDIHWLIEQLVSHGVDVNAREERFGNSALVHHLKEGIFEYAKVLLDLGADPTILVPTRWGPAQYAVAYNISGFLRRLHKHVTEADIALPWERTYSICGNLGSKLNREETIHKVSDLHLASASGSIECLSFLLDKHLLTDVNATSAEGYTPLHFAAVGRTENYLSILEILCSKGANLHAKAKDGSTPLHVAAKNGFLSGVMFLLESGASESFNAYCTRPRCYAAQKGHDSIVQCLDAARSAVVGEPSALGQAMPSEKRAKLLAIAFEDAIMADDLDECKRPEAEGCPFDVPMPKRRWLSPLVAALLLGKAAIATSTGGYWKAAPVPSHRYPVRIIEASSRLLLESQF